MSPADKAEKLGASQFAVGNCVGASGVALLLQALYDGGTVGATAAKAKNKDKPPDGASADGPPMVLVSLDFKKAFHSIYHECIRDVVNRNAPELNYYVETMYAHAPVEIIFHDNDDPAKTIRRFVERGVLPGDPPGTLIMCLVLRDVLQPLADEFPDVVTVAFADDNNGWLPLARLEAFFVRFGELTKPAGLELNAKKSKALLKGGNAADRLLFEQICAKLGIAVAVGGMVICGLPVGEPDYAKHWAAKLTDRVIEEQRAIIAVLDTPQLKAIPRRQMIYAIIRHTGSASFTWAARGLHPAVLIDAATRLDAELRNIFYDALNLDGALARVDHGAKVYAQARLTLSKARGGVALSRCVIALEGARLAAIVDLSVGLRREHGAGYQIADLFPDAAAAFEGVCKVAAGELPKSKLLSYGSFEELAAHRRGKYVQYAVADVHDAQLFGEILVMQGVSPRAAHLNASKGGQALAAIDGTARFLATRLNDAEFRSGIAATLGLPQTPAGITNQCPCGEADNAATGEHAYVCPRDKARQQQASKGQIALGVVIASLPALKLVGHNMRGMNRRPFEVPFQYAADNAGLVIGEGTAGRTFDAGFTTPDGTLILVDAMRTALIHKGTLENVCDPKTGQRHAVEAGDKAKLYSYQKAISNFAAKRHHIFFATTDTCGNISNDYDKLIKLVARVQHPGVGIEGKYDVDGLRSQAVAFARRTVAAGVWRANYMTISAWASRTYGAVAVV